MLFRSIHLQSELSYNKVLVFNLGFNKKSDYKDEHWIYVPGRDYNYYRIGFYDNILDSDKLSMYIEIGYSKNAEIHVEEQLKELSLIHIWEIPELIFALKKTVKRCI